MSIKQVLLSAVAISLSAQPPTFQFPDSLVQQPVKLAATHDGSALYFASDLRLKGTDQPTHGKIFAWDSRGFRLHASRPAGGPFFNLRWPQVSGDGAIVAFQGHNPCEDLIGCLAAGGETTLRSAAGELKLPGTISLSRNGRYAVNYDAPGAFPAGATDLIDLATGQRTRLPNPFGALGVAQRVADSGVTLLIDRGQLVLWRGQTAQPLPNTEFASKAVMDATAGAIVYATGFDFETFRGALPAPTRLIRFDVASGRETILATSTPFTEFGCMSISADGSTVAVVRDIGLVGIISPVPLPPGRIVPPQEGELLVFASGVNSGRRLPRSVPAQCATLSGDGRFVFALNREGLTRINLDSGQTQELSPPLPAIRDLDRGGAPSVNAVVPGSLLRLLGSGFQADTRIRLGGRDMSSIAANSETLVIQVPWDMLTGPARLELSGTDSPFESGPASISVVAENPLFYSAIQTFPPGFSTITQNFPILAYRDDGRQISGVNPAKAGDVIHVYMSGLGAVDQDVALGQPSPANPPARLRAPLRCSVNGSTAEVLFAGLAPGQIGIYQVDLRVPPLLRPGGNVNCGGAQGFIFTE